MKNKKPQTDNCGQFEAGVIKKLAVVLPNIVLENQGSCKHRGWNNLLHKVCTYTNNRLKDFALSYQNRFLLLLLLLIQRSRRWLSNHHFLSNVSHQNKRCISFYKILNKFENNINHIQSREATFRFKFSPQVNTIFGFYVQQVFHNFSFVYNKYNKYNSQSQVVNKLAL